MCAFDSVVRFLSCWRWSDEATWDWGKRWNKPSFNYEWLFHLTCSKI